MGFCIRIDGAFSTYYIDREEWSMKKTLVIKNVMKVSIFFTIGTYYLLRLNGSLIQDNHSTRDKHE